MGVQKLRAKVERNYRKGPTWKACSGCTHFVRNFEVRGQGGEGRKIAVEARCRLIGLEHGRGYRILPHYICDDHEQRERTAL